MKRFLFLAATLVSVAINSFGQAPVIGPGGVVPAATYAPSGLPSSGIAQGSFFSIFGTNLGPTTAATISSGAVPTTLGNVTVGITVGSTTTNALLFVVSAGQINAVLPSSTPVGSANVVVTYNGVASAPEPISVVASNFGTFTQNSAGTGPADAQDFTQNYQLTTLTHTAKPGDTEILYGTGLGPNPGGDQSSTGAVAQSNLLPNLDFHLYVGGIDATSAVTYAGRSGFVGLDQINFVVPSGVTGCYVPVAVRIGSSVSNFGSISIDANGGTCSDPFGLTPAQINQAVSGKLSVASILLTRLSLSVPLITITEDDASAHFYQFNSSSVPVEHNADFLGLSSFGSCVVTNCANTSTCVPSAQGLPGVAKLNAGPALQVSGGGNSASVPLDTNGDGYYSVNLGSSPIALPGFPKVNFLAPGTFTVTGPGGPDIGAFTASINVPAPLTLNVSPAVSATSGILDRTKDLTFTFTGSSSDYILMSASSATNAGTRPSGQYNSATVTCLQKASAGTFTIPSYLLQTLPVSSTLSVGGLTLPSGAVLVGTYNVSNTFTSSADVSLANSIVSSGTNTTVK